MTKKEFKQVLERKGYSYKIEGDKIVVTYEMGVDLRSLTSLPPGVEFNNGGSIDLYYLTSLPPGVAFKNGGYVDLRSLTSLPPDVEFNNEGGVFLKSLIGDWFYSWKGNIEGIDEKRLLNKMISLGLFER